MNLVSLLDKWVKQIPETPAIIESQGGRDTVLTFADLEKQIAACAGRLKNAGLNSGDAVLVFQPMSARLYVVLLALMRIGAIAMFLDPSAGRKHMELCCATLLPKAFIATPKAHLLRLTSSSLRRIPKKFSSAGTLPGAPALFRNGAVGEKENFPATKETPALVTFTSGSTGIPKGAVRTHGLLLAQFHALVPAIELKTGDVDLATLPIFALANLAAGMTTVIPEADLRKPGEIDPGPVLRQIERLNISRCAASPAFFECLLKASLPEKDAMKKLRRIYTGGAPVFPDLLDRLAEACPECDPVAVYGSTEAEPIAHIARSAISKEDRERMNAGGGLIAGHFVPEVSLRIEEETGEIIVTGEHVLRGYLNGIGDNETKIKDGDKIWHRTGDAGRCDDDGKLWLLGRVGAVIRDGAGTVHPFAVECAARQFSWVNRSALIAFAGKRLLVVEPAQGTQASSKKMAALKEKLTWAGLDTVLLVERIPVDKRHNAKVDYPALLALLGKIIHK
ncbi:MAG: AMP-binding protein [Puniceicoccales bacterium]|jgi:acyl-coenzyme A synthetase/AMP-(fatty) acid ligase|nr:AMP-binding protein [Puniceicoccales bacterium]